MANWSDQSDDELIRYLDSFGTFLMVPHNDACPAGWGEPYVDGGGADIIPGTCGGATPQMAYREGELDREALDVPLPIMNSGMIGYHSNNTASQVAGMNASGLKLNLYGVEVLDSLGTGPLYYEHYDNTQRSHGGSTASKIYPSGFGSVEIGEAPKAFAEANVIDGLSGSVYGHQFVVYDSSTLGVLLNLGLSDDGALGSVTTPDHPWRNNSDGSQWVCVGTDPDGDTALAHITITESGGVYSFGSYTSTKIGSLTTSTATGSTVTAGTLTENFFTLAAPGSGNVYISEPRTYIQQDQQVLTTAQEVASSSPLAAGDIYYEIEYNAVTGVTWNGGTVLVAGTTYTDSIIALTGYSSDASIIPTCNGNFTIDYSSSGIEAIGVVYDPVRGKSYTVARVDGTFRPTSIHHPDSEFGANHPSSSNLYYLAGPITGNPTKTTTVTEFLIDRVVPWYADFDDDGTLIYWERRSKAFKSAYVDEYETLINTSDIFDQHVTCQFVSSTETSRTDELWHLCGGEIMTYALNGDDANNEYPYDSVGNELLVVDLPSRMWCINHQVSGGGNIQCHLVTATETVTVRDQPDTISYLFGPLESAFDGQDLSVAKDLDGAILVELPGIDFNESGVKVKRKWFGMFDGFGSLMLSKSDIMSDVGMTDPGTAITPIRSLPNG